MQSLRHILNSEDSQYNYQEARNYSIFEKVLNDFTDDYIYIDNAYTEFDGNIDKFFESLISHDAKTLQNKLEEKFSKYFDAFIDIDRTDIIDDNLQGFGIRLKNGIRYNDLQRDKDFMSLLKFFNYYLGYVHNNYVPILPLYPNKVEVNFSKCYNLYHFTYKDHAEKILKSGLRTKTSIGTMPERIYLYLPKNGKTITKDEIEQFKYKILDSNLLEHRGLSIIKFDFYKYMQDYKHPYTLYKDAGMNETEAVFGIIPIPAKYLKEINIK